MSPESRFVAGLLLVIVPTIAFGGTFLLRIHSAKLPGFYDVPLRLTFFRAGHAHAGVLTILALVGLRYVDETSLGDALRAFVRWAFFAAPLLVSGGFFGAVMGTGRVEKPNRLVALIWMGAAALSFAVIATGIGLLTK